MTGFKGKISNAGSLFWFNSAIQHIYGELDFSECTKSDNAFNTANLVTITPKANTIKIPISFNSCSKLSTTSIQSIFRGLCSGVSAQTLTLSTKLNNEAQEMVNGYLVTSDDGTTKIVVDGEEKVGWTLAQ
jgi:hypothetical protein